MKTLEEIAKASHAAYIKESSRQGIPELMVLEFATDWSELDKRHQAAWIAATRQALAEAAIAPIAVPVEEVPQATTTALATADPEAHRQALVDHEAETDRALKNDALWRLGRSVGK